MTRLTIPNGALIANSHCHGPTARIAAATVGPTAADDRDDEGVEADAAAEQSLRIGEAHQRAVDREHAGGADALPDPRHDQLRHVLRQRAGDRAESEDRQAPEIDAAIADLLAERGERQQPHHHRELIGVDDPDRFGRAGVELGGDRRQGDVGDRPIEHRHGDADGDRQHRPIAQRGGKAVGMNDSDQFRLSSARGAARRFKMRAPL